MASSLNSLAFFIMITIIYIIVKITIIMNETKFTKIFHYSNNLNIYSIIYILIVLFGNYILNKQIEFELKDPSVDVNNFKIVLITILPWLVIFGSLFIILNIFTAWNKPFSNTLGYFIVNLLGVEKEFQEVFKDVNSNDGGAEQINDILTNIGRNKTMIINEMNTEIEEFKQFMNMLCKANLLKAGLCEKDTITIDNPNVINIYKFVVIKDEIGKVIWYILAGMLISTVSYNSLIEQL